MGAAVEVTLTCDWGRCDRRITMLVPVGGRHADAMVLDFDSAHAPDGWFFGVEPQGYGADRALACGCPEHFKQVRGF